jgi:hypothetical protein
MLFIARNESVCFMCEHVGFVIITHDRISHSNSMCYNSVITIQTEKCNQFH